MKQKSFTAKLFLFPLSILYGMGIRIRNWMFNSKLLKSREYDLPIISVGNITVGGTGKTPHTEYILALLNKTYKTAMLSRGYKRKTRGYVLADEHSTGQTIGDEPYQMKRKFPHVVVAVDANRRRGIAHLMQHGDNQSVQVIVLDDAFQHRYVHAGMTILITDYNRLITEDNMLPYGQLREHADNKNRANIVIVSKCPAGAQPIDFRIISKKLNLFPYQSLYFTMYEYGEISPLFPEQAGKEPLTKQKLKEKNAIVPAVAGIASPEDFFRHVNTFVVQCDAMAFPDHHHFTPKDYQAILHKIKSIAGTKAIIVTEKDAARMADDPSLPETLKPFIYFLPIQVKFLLHQEESFNEQILNYVTRNSRNSVVSAKKN